MKTSNLTSFIMISLWIRLQHIFYTYCRSEDIKKETILTAYKNSFLLRIWLRAWRACSSCIDITYQLQFFWSL
jgi:hypothetical protein